MSIGSNIRLYREASGIPLKNFAERVNLTFEQMSAIEKDIMPITDFLTLLRICENLNSANGGMRLEELLEENGKPKLLPMKLPQYVREYILTRKKRRNLTSKELAQKLGISRPTIERLLSGNYGDPKPFVLQNVLTYFGINASDLSTYYEMNYKPKEMVKPKEEKKEDLSAKLYSLDDIIKLSNAVKIYNNVDSCVAQIDNAIKTLQLVKDMLLNKD